jgi:hypothetical protein
LFCAPGLIFGGSEGVGVQFSCFARSRTRFRRCGGRRVQFSCFALPDSFSAVPRASSPVNMFCAPGLIFGGTEGVGYRFHVLRAHSFSAVTTASCPVFMFCAPGHVFGSAGVVGSLFHVLRSRTRFRWFRGRRVQFSCFALPDSFSAVSRASGNVFM